MTTSYWDPNEYSIYRKMTRKFATRRLDEMLRYVIVLVVFLYVLKVYLDYSPGYVIDNNFADIVPGQSSSNLLETICSNETKRCYGIMDYAEE
jgi:hypothetical protein